MKNVIKKHWKLLAASVASVLVAGVMGTYVQFLKGDLLDSAIAGAGEDALRFALLFFAAIAIEITAYFGYDYFSGKFGVNNKKALREMYFSWLLGRGPVEVAAARQGEFVAQYTDQLDQINASRLDTIPLLIEIISKAVIVSVSLFVLDYRVALITLFLLSMPLYVPKLAEKSLQRAKTESVESFQKHLGGVVEWIGGFELIKNYSIERVILNKFRQSNEAVAEKLFAFKKITVVSRLITTVLSYVSHFIVIAVTAYLVLRGEFSAGEFFIAVGLIDQLSYPIIAISAYLQQFLGAKPMARSMEELFAEKPADSGRTVELHGISGVAFEQVTFAYDGAEPVLKDFSLSVSAGEKCLIMGPSGSGKSTGMNLLMGYYQPSSGSIRLNGANASAVKGLNEKIAVMRQDPVLFQDTVRNNLTMYRDIPDARLIALLEKLNLHKFASVEGLNTVLHEGGSNLSGGERKRIALARTLLRNAPITIIDEPLANVDAETAAKIEDILTEPGEGILFVITHQFREEKTAAFAKRITL